MTQNLKRWHIIEKLINEYDGKVCIVEIGSFEGKTMKYITSNCEDKLSQYFIIDPYIAYQDYNNPDEDIRSDQKKLDAALKSITKYIKDKSYIKHIQSCSNDAHEYFEDKSVDIVFIDGNHKFEYVYLDIVNWMPKVKEGGYLVGHDYSYPGLEGVAKAVNVIIGRKNINLDHDYIWKYKVEVDRDKR